MATRTVRDVMTDMVVVVRKETTYKEIVDAIADFGVSALPVVGEDGRVVGIVSETDLMHKLEFAGTARRAGLFGGLRSRLARVKAAGDTAGELMTSPVVTIHPDATVAEATHAMEKARVCRLPVVDRDNRLLGIVARRDLLRVFLRPDREIQREIVTRVFGELLTIEPDDILVAVDHGIVRLAGVTDRRSTARIAVRLTRAVPGVVDVIDELTYGYDDTADIHRHHVFDAAV